MEQSNIESGTKKQRRKAVDFSALRQSMSRHRTAYYRVLGITFILACIYAFSLPRRYTCRVMLAPELSNTGGRNYLSVLASSFGLTMGTARTGSEALFPTLYPDLMKSVDFRTSLFEVPVHRDYDSLTMTYYDYLLHEQKRPWWSAAARSVIGGIASLLSADAQKQPAKGAGDVNPFRLTRRQTDVTKMIGRRIRCLVDKKTLVITIQVTDQDPLICATMADTVQSRLQQFITNYRTSKAREDLEYSHKIYAEAKRDYDKARQMYASFSDANQDIILQSVRMKLTDLENEMQLKYNAYTAVATQLQSAKARVQEETPAFTTIQSATVPVRPSAPNRMGIILLWLFMAFVGTSFWAFYKDKQLKSFLGIS